MSLQIVETGSEPIFPPSMIPTASVVNPLAEEVSNMLPEKMLKKIKDLKHEIALIHTRISTEHKLVATYLGYSHSALHDAENFIKKVMQGEEEFTAVPEKPVLSAEDSTVSQAGFVKVPDNLEDMPYMQEWAGGFFFPELRKLVKRIDIEVDIRGEVTPDKIIQLAISVAIVNGINIVLPEKYQASDLINLAVLASVMDEL